MEKCSILGGVKPFVSLVALGAALVPILSVRPVPVVEPLPAPAHAPATVAPVPPPPVVVGWATTLPALRIFNTHTGATCSVHLYAADGDVDELAAAEIDRIATERDAAPRPLDRRVLRLIVKAAAHFDAAVVNLVSTYRDSARSGSRHRSGEAVDFSMPGVSAVKLAAHLRENARVGVGVYTNRRTQFVHLDVREQSYHWVDASPPGRVWRETRLPDRTAPARDAAYRMEQDLPGGAGTR